MKWVDLLGKPGVNNAMRMASAEKILGWTFVPGPDPKWAYDYEIHCKWMGSDGARARFHRCWHPHRNRDDFALLLEVSGERLPRHLRLLSDEATVAAQPLAFILWQGWSNVRGALASLLDLLGIEPPEDLK